MEITLLFVSLVAYFIIAPFTKLKENKILRIIVITIIGTLLLTVSAKIKIPFYPVPMTMQTFAVLFIGVTLGYKVGLLTVSLYLLEGIAGYPVFANSPEKGIGIVYFTGPTMGYLIGFLIAAYLAGCFKYKDCFEYKKTEPEISEIEQLLNPLFNIIENIFSNFLKLLFAVTFIYLLGLIWLGLLFGWDKPIFQMGALPFLPAELFKLLLLSITAGYIKKLKKITKVT